MKLVHNSELDKFFAACRNNLQTENKNQFLDKKVTAGNERYLQKQMAECGFAEFMGPEDQWPSLFLSAKQWQNTPYHRTIHLSDIKSDAFSYEMDQIDGHRLFNACAIQKDPKRELNDWMKLRAMDQDCDCIALFQNDEDWMLDSPSEALTNDPAAEMASGSVCTFGLGIGYYLFMAMHNPDVTSITVVERSREVIELFEKSILPQFDVRKPLKLICGDAFDFFNEAFLSSFDTVYVDIWQSSDDGLECMTRLLEQYLPPYESTSFWIEDSCLETVWTIVYLYLESCYTGVKPAIAEQYQPLLHKTELYFSTLNETVDSIDRLKDLIYDNRILRTILSIHERS